MYIISKILGYQKANEKPVIKVQLHILEEKLCYVKACEKYKNNLTLYFPSKRYVYINNV